MSLLTRRRGRTDLTVRTSAIETAIDAGGDRLDPAAVAAAREVLRRSGERLRLGADHTVVALAGATGSGKSSLFNALVGMHVVEVGARRPTTSSPTAVTWGADGASALLDWLEVPRRHRTARESALDGDHESPLHGLVLLDLPDHDSTEVAHRLEVERLVALVDLLVWVVDPQKYADEALHARYLRRLAGHRAVTLVVLNQVDTLDAAEAEACRRDLRRLLDDDGLDGVRLLTTSARRGDGVAKLRTVLAEVVRQKSATVDRLAADLDAAGAALASGVGAGEMDPAGVEAGRGDLSHALAAAAGVPAVAAAVQGSYRRRALGATGWPPLRWARRLRPDPLRRLRLGGGAPSMVGDGDAGLVRSSVPEATPAARARVDIAARAVTDAASEGLPPRWADAVQAAAQPLSRADDLSDALDQAVVGTPLPTAAPRWWAVVGALQTVLLLTAGSGLVWLVGLAVVAWLQLPDPPAVEVGPFAAPTVLLVGGALAGLLLAVASGRCAAVGARRRRRRAERDLGEAVAEVAHARVLEPVAEVLAEHRRTREALAQLG